MWRCVVVYGKEAIVREEHNIKILDRPCPRQQFSEKELVRKICTSQDAATAGTKRKLSRLIAASVTDLVPCCSVVRKKY
jgi:hypothetical protein